MSKDWEEKFRPEDLQRLRGFRLMDDDFMSKCFEENIECTELVLRIVLDRDDLKVEKVAIQHQLKNLQGRSIIFDIYATDHAGKRYNVEIQRADRGAGAKRARYHSSLIDANVTEPGEKLENLVETYVIFITERDVLGKGKPIYHIERVIKETGENFGDEAHILYVNGEYRDESPIGILMHDFSCTDAKDMRYRALAERVRYFKEDEAFNLRLIVIYTSDVQSAEAILETDCFTLRTEQAFLSHIDGEATFREIQGKLQSGIPLADDDLMRLVILPLTVPGTEGKQDMLERIVDLAGQIPDERQRIFTLSGVVVASDKFINREYLDQIRRRINMTQLGQLYEKEKIEYGNQKAREKVVEIAKSLLEDGTEIVKIMRATGLTEEELLNLQNELLTV